MRIPLKRWPGHHLSLPIGLELYLTEARANKLKVPYRSRSAWARRIGDHGAAALPTRALRVATDGRYAPQAFYVTSPPTSMWSGVFSSRPTAIHCRPHVSKASAGRRAKKATGWARPRP